MGLSSSKTKTTNDPWAPAQPFILKGMQQTNQVFDQNQPTLEKMSGLAQDAFQKLAPTAFSPSPYVTGAQNAASNIAGGAYMGNNPGAATYDAIQNGANPALAPLSGLANGGGVNPAFARLSDLASGTAVNPATGHLNAIAGGDYSNPADTYAQSVVGGKYLNAQPSAGVYGNIMSADYLKGNPYIDQIVAQTGADVQKQANQRFGAAGMGSGLSSAFADLLSKNLAKNETGLRYQNYNDSANRQLTAAGQSDAAFSAERNRQMDANGLISGNYNTGQQNRLTAANALGSQFLTGQQNQLSAAGALGSQFLQGQQNQTSAANALGSQFSQQQQNQLAAAGASDASRNAGIAQMLEAAGLAPSLSAAQYNGVTPALSLLNTAADIPYVGTAALNGQIRQASNGYGTSTTKSNQSIMSGLGQLGQAAGTAAMVFSDIRLKRDIEPAGQFDDGLGIYRYRYLWDDEPRVGVMAHEVAVHRPWALGPEIGGYATVNYGAL